MALAKQLRILRESRRLSIAQMARVGGVSESTVRRWEASESTKTPRFYEISRTLDALHASQTERLAILAAHPEFSYRPLLTDAVLPASSGDLLRALRMRRGIGVRQLAREIGVAPGVITHWETGKHIPSTDQSERLLIALRALPDEFAILRRGTSELGITRFVDASLDELWAALESLYQPIWRGDPTFPGDLVLLALQEEAARRLLTEPQAQRLLAEAFHARGLFLHLRERSQEAQNCLKSSLALVTAKEHPVIWFGATSLLARVQPRSKCEVAIKGWTEAIPLARDRRDQALESQLLRELATRQARVGYLGSALRTAREAEACALRSDRVEHVRDARMVLSVILAEAGHADKATKTMSAPPTLAECEEHPIGAMNRLLYWARLCWHNKDRLGASEHLGQVYSLIERFHLPQFEGAARKLEQALSC